LAALAVAVTVVIYHLLQSLELQTEEAEVEVLGEILLGKEQAEV
jgi:hypothetical protein